ncbi:hypothetical protein SAMN05192539_1007238 [Paraburkholderia diazotrophica]|uniref:Uncharacterized protein n=1 Tax=Paraburkholderia diazotrophica TaxID=667676 RepID=A0A1H6WSG7_9BURK|nr:hypothetical protein SAMN05192539_1007238 [Paraburkholderia diazotrophica]
MRHCCRTWASRCGRSARSRIGPLIDTCDAIVLPAGQHRPLVGILDHHDVLVHQRAGKRRVVQQVHHPVVLHRQCVGYPAWHAIGQYLPEILVTVQRPMRVVIASRRFAETPVEVRDEGGRIRIGCLPRADATQPQLLDEAVLQRQVGALHASLRLARVRAERVDIELVQGPAELRDAVARRRRTVLHMEDTGLVAVERHRLAVRTQIRRQRLKVAEGRLRRREVQRDQPPGRVIDEHQQRARGRPGLARTPLSRPLTTASMTLMRCSSFMLIVTRPGSFITGSVVCVHQQDAARGTQTGHF